MTRKKRSSPTQVRVPSPRASGPRRKKPFGFEVVYQIPGELPLDGVLLTEDQSLELRIANVLLRDAEAIILNKIDAVTVEAYHFLIQFKAGQLASATTTVEGSNWAVLRREDTTTGTTNVYLAWKSATKRLEAGETLSLVFKGLFARPDAALSLPMLLSWPEPDIGDSSQNLSPLRIEPRIPGQGDEYETEEYLILEKKVWAGRTTIPLRLDCVGPNQVMNAENAESTLVLRLTNTAPSGSQGENVEFKYVSSITARSFLKLKVPVGTTAARPFALCTIEQVNGITRALSGWTVQTGTPNSDNTEMTFGFVPTATRTLAPGAYLEITLTKVVSSHPSGITHLELEFGQVPGFRDGKLTVALEKTPMVLGRGTQQGHVGWGSTAPTARLFVRDGHIRMSSNQSEFQNQGPLVLRSDSDDGGDDRSLSVFHGTKQTNALMELDSNGTLRLRTASGQHGFNHTDGTRTVGTYVNASGGWVGTRSSHALNFFTGNGDPSVTLSTNGNLWARGSLDIDGRYTDKTGAVMPVGAVVAFGGTTAPGGWLLCQGQELLITAYQDLYNVLNTAFGSAASGSFRLPDLRKRVPVGVSGTTYPRGATGGAETHTLTSTQIPAHSHTVNDPGHTHSMETRNDENRKTLRRIQAWISSNSNIYSHSTNSSRTGITLSNTGGGGSHNNMQPYAVLNYIIKF
jgi:microcystin-dependent protein